MVEKHPDEKPAKRGLTFDLGVPFRWAEEKISQAYQSLKGNSKRIWVGIGVTTAIATGIAAAVEINRLQNYGSEPDLSQNPVYVAELDDIGDQGYIVLGDNFFPLNKGISTAMNFSSLESSVNEEIESAKTKRKEVYTNKREEQNAKTDKDSKLVESIREKARGAWGYNNPKKSQAEEPKMIEEPNPAREFQKAREEYREIARGVRK